MPDSFLDKARAIVDSHTIENDEHADEVLDRASLIEEFASALRSAATVPDGHIRQGTTDMPLLGTLPMTADGCVAGDCAEVFRNDLGEVLALRMDKAGATESIECDGCFWPVDEIFGTREAAEAARAGRAP